MIHSGTFLTTRRAEEVFDLLADPHRFAPLLPDFECMTVQDASHFTLQIAISVAQISGHANLAMELFEAVRPCRRVSYRGRGIVAGSQLNLNLEFQIAPSAESTEVSWQGEFSLDGMLALMAGHLIEPMGRRNFELMAERLQNGLSERTSVEPSIASEPSPDRPDPDSHSID
jgi:carbon monoxide dehydrogenase subunit G